MAFTRLLPIVTVLLLFVQGRGALHAQDVLLGAPLLAAGTAEQDRILLYDVTNGTTRTLRFGEGMQQVWGFVAGGCRLLFTMSDGITPAKLYSVALDGSDMRSLVTYDDLSPEAWGVWDVQPSPDGTRIAFVLSRALPEGREDGRRDYRIAWVDAAGGTPTFYSVSGDEHSPQWSPDGAWLAYVSFEQRVPGADPNSTAIPTPEPPPGQTAPRPLSLLREADLWMVRADGEEKYRLTYFDTGSVGMPRWSPDGDLLGFVYSPSPGNDQFWMVGAEPGATATQRSAALSLALDLTWLPDGSAMLAAARDFRGVAQNLLWRIPLVGSADTDATPYLDDTAYPYADYPRFSSGGRWLAFRSAYALALLETATGETRLLDAITLGNTPPVWSPAGFEGELGC